MKRFFADVAISAAVSLLLLMLIDGVLAGQSLGVAIALAFGLLIFGPIVLVVLLGAGAYGAFKALAHGRLGLIFGLPLVLTATPLFATILAHSDAQTVEGLVVRPFQSPAPSSRVVVMDDWKGNCDLLCLQLLASGRYEVVQGGKLHRLVTGDQCLSTTTLADTALDFARAGYAHLCASKEAPPSQGILRVDLRSVSRSRPDGILPSSFTGDVYELTQRDATGDHLLGRWISGAVEPRLPQLLLLPAAMLGVDFGHSIGPRFSRIEFYNAAFSTALSSATVPGKSDPRVILAQLQRLPEPTAKNDRLSRLLEIIQKKAFILDALEAAATDNSTPKYDEIAAAFSALNELPQAETGFVTDVIQDLAKRDDPRLLSVILASLMSLQDRSFANEVLVRLATQPMSEEEEIVLSQSLMRAVIFAWKTSEERLEVIKETYSHDLALRPIQRWIILKMIADNQGRVKAVEMVLDLQSPLFEQSVQAAQLHGRFAIPLLYRDGWTYPECSTLSERAMALPTSNLMAYLESLLNQCSNRWLKGRGPEEMFQKLHARMVAIESSTNRNSSDAQNIREVLERFAPSTVAD